jgi:hypothetical protein
VSLLFQPNFGTKKSLSAAFYSAVFTEYSINNTNQIAATRFDWSLAGFK